MTLKTDMIEALDDMFDDESFGEAVVYNGNPVQAIVDLGRAPDDNGHTGRRRGSVIDEGEIEVMVAQVPVVAYHDKIEIGGVLWRVRRIFSSDFHSHHLEIYRNERPRI